MQVKLTFSEKYGLCGFSKTQFYLHGSSFFVIFYFLCFFVILRATSKIAVLLASELNSGEPDRDFSVLL